MGASDDITASPQSDPEAWGPERRREVVWHDPGPTAAAGMQMAGLEYLHGGLMCTLLDSVAGCAVHTTLPAGVGYTSIEIKVSYMRPVKAGVPLLARGWVTKRGNRVSFADGEITDPEGRKIATASSSCLILRP